MSRLSFKSLPPDRLHALLACRERAATGARGAEDLAGHGRRRHLRNLCSVCRLGPDSAIVRRTPRCTTALGQRCSSPLLQDKIVPLLSVVVTWSDQMKSYSRADRVLILEVAQRDGEWG